MVRSYWIGPLLGALALTGLARGQTTTPALPAKATDPKERLVTVGDADKPGQKCRVLKTWTTPSGHAAYQVQALDTGELMTIEEADSAAGSTPGAVFRPQAMRIFRWGRDGQTMTHEAPQPLPNAVVIAQPVNVHSSATNPAVVAAPLTPATEKPQGKWPAAFTDKKPADAAPVSPPAAKKIKPVAPPVVKKNEPTPPRPAPTVAKPMQTAPTPLAPLVVGSPTPKPKAVESPVVKAPEMKPSPYGAKAHEAKVVAAAESSSPRTDVKPPSSYFWSAVTTYQPAAPTPTLTKSPEPPVVKAAPTVAAKAETTPAQPGDWRESWGKISAPKPAPLRLEERSATATAPKVDLPHAAVSADDPLSVPEKFAALRHADEGGAFGKAIEKEDKRPFLALLATNQPPATLKVVEEKKPQRTAIVVLPPPAPVAPVEAPAPPEIKTPPFVQTPPAPAPILPPAPAKGEPIAAEVKPEAKPEAPLGMQSALAVRSPELAPAVPAKPSASKTQAMGIGLDEPNAFSPAAPAGKSAAASGRFWAPKKPETSAIPQPAAAAPAVMPAPFLAQAAYQQEISPELSQLSAVLHQSHYPSQREWAAERLGSMDWRQQPQVVDLLLEGAKQDAAPTVRAECVRSLGRLKSDAPGVVEAVKSLRSDDDPRVRQEANQAFAAFTRPEVK